MFCIVVWNDGDEDGCGSDPFVYLCVLPNNILRGTALFEWTDTDDCRKATIWNGLTNDMAEAVE